MLKTRWKSFIWTAATVLLAAGMVLGAVSISNALNASAEGAVTSEMSAGGVVTANELAYRHILIDGEGDASAVIIDAAKARSVLQIDGAGTLHGWKQSAINSLPLKAILVIPKEVKNIAAANTENPTDLNGENTVSFAGLGINAGTGGTGGPVPTLERTTETLVGVMFEAGSTITEIGESAFNGCTNMRACVLPDGVTTIAKEAFSSCTALRDIVIPESVTAIGEKAFFKNVNLYHVSLPGGAVITENAFDSCYALVDIEYGGAAEPALSGLDHVMNAYQAPTPGDASSYRNKSFLYYTDDPVNRFVFSYNRNVSDSDTLATLSASNKIGYKESWYFVGFAGDEVKSPFSTFVTYNLPESFDLSAVRTRVKYDFLNCKGEKINNTFSNDTTVDGYDINSSACFNTYFSSIVIPDCVNVIGDYAFLNSHVMRADIGKNVSAIGMHAFRGVSATGDGSPRRSNNIYYIRNTRNTEIQVGPGAFAARTVWSERPVVDTPAVGEAFNPNGRTFIFSDSLAFDKETGGSFTLGSSSKYNRAGDSNVTATFLVPVNMTESSGSGDKVTFYQNRLYQNSYRTLPQTEGSWLWVAQTPASVPLPKLEGYKETVWYTDGKFTTKVTLENIDTLQPVYTKGKLAEIKLYTKKLSDPAVDDKTYTYGDLTGEQASFDKALGIDGGDFTAEFVSMRNFEGVTFDVGYSRITDAGVYTLRLQPDKDKWGVWTAGTLAEDTAKGRIVTVTVNKKPVDMGEIANIITWNVAGGNPLGGTGEGAELYQYDDGWYLNKQGDKLPLVTTNALLNSYVRLTGDDITVQPVLPASAGEAGARIFDINNTVGNTREKESGTGYQQATTVLEIKNNNYVFSDTSVEANKDTLAKYGTSVSVIGGQAGTATINKVWYVVTVGNWLMPAPEDGNPAPKPDDPFHLVTYKAAPVTEWNYDEQITVHIPQAANKTDADSVVTFSVTYETDNDTVIKKTSAASDTGVYPVSDLHLIINAAMPAGTYSVRFTAEGGTDSEGTQYPGIDETVRLTVNKAVLNTAAIQNKLTAKEFETACANERNPVLGSVYLYPEDTVTAELTVLNSSLNQVYTKGDSNITDEENANNVWKRAEYKKYYGEAEIAYNLDSMMTSSYHSLDELNGREESRVPKRVGEYRVYYSVSAPNYVPLGGQGAGDTERRNYYFDTTIYLQLSLENPLERISAYRIEYTGRDARPAVTYSPYFSYAFPDDENYVDARNNCNVTLTVAEENKNLYRWDKDSANGNSRVTVKDNVVTITFDITSVANSWTTAPQLSGWVYGNFDASVYRINAMSAWGGTMYFRLGKLNGGSYEWVDLSAAGNECYSVTYTDDSGNTVTLDNLFRLSADEQKQGQVTEKIAQILNRLPQGQYVLGSYIEGIESSTAAGLFNVKPYETNSTQYAQVVVSKTGNRWTQSPKIVSWIWDNYSDARNVITAVALNGTEIRFSILNADKKLISPALTTFELTGGKVSADVSKALQALDAGTYYLLASLAGTDSYEGLNEIPASLILFGSGGLTDEAKNFVFGSEQGFDPISFEIAILTGRFDKTPAVIDWTYSEFSQSTNFVGAEASFGGNYGSKQEIPVRYELTKASAEVWTGKTYAEAAALLAELSAGDYVLCVYTVHADIGKNFTKAESNISFTVSRLENSWTVPALSGWTYNSPNTLADPNPTKGEATYTLNGTEYGTLALLNAELAMLGASDTDYTLVVSVAEDAQKYTGLSQTIIFRVSRDSFGWTAEPSVNSFTWDNGTSKVTPSNGTLNSKWNSANDGKIERKYFKTVWDAQSLSYQWDATQPLDGAPSDAGTYVYVTRIPATVDRNYAELTHGAFFEIRQAGNQWTGNGTSGGQITNKNITFEWHKAEFTFFGAQYGNVNFTVGGNSYTADTLVAGLNTLSAGTHSLTCTVAQTPNYLGLSSTIKVTVEKAENDWSSDGKLNIATSFGWGTKDSAALRWITPKPDVGDVVAITVSVNDGASLFYMELHVNGSSEGLEGEIQNLLGRLMALGVGKYKITAVVAETDNCKGCKAEKIFTVEKAINDWKEGGEPALSATEWIYNTPEGTPSAEAKHGSVTYTYYAKAADGTRTKLGNTMPSDAGNYSVGFSVLAGANENFGSVAEEFIDFTIKKANNAGFSTNPYAIGWTWNAFDKSVNLFGAIPLTGGAVTFSVQKNGSVVDGLSGIKVNAQNVIIDSDGSIAKKLNALDAGNYELTVTVGEVRNYLGFEASAVFTVSPAPNRWTTNPNIARWSEYYFKADQHTPKAVALYGDTVIEVKGKQDGKTYYKSVGGVAEIEKLNVAMGGWYTFTAAVAGNKNYSALDYSIEFQVFTESADMPNNYWLTVPAIDSWIAGSPAPEPAGEPLRGAFIVSYCRAELVNGKYVATGEPFGQIPEAPGKYFMLARVEQPQYPQDEKLKLDVMFEIFERANEWTVAPSIQSWSLGDGPSTPAADVLYKEDCVIDIKYKLKYSDDEPTAQLPDKPGTYLMIVRATAKYCAPLEAEIEFTVSLSQNSWVSAPSIKDWSEEFAASDPFGEAAVGSEHIVYTYARADKPEERFTEKPTTEGDYIMYATLALDGYETLTAEYAFSISPAFDSSLLTIDIILGVLACLTTGFVIYFAIKRYKQY